MEVMNSYLFIIREDPAAYDALAPDERRRSMDRWNEWVDGMAARGQLQRGDPLQPSGRLVRASPTGRALDGPFAETKEIIAGYFLVTARGLDQASSLAQDCPNLRYGMTIEVRPLASACELARSLGWETMREPGTV